MLKIEKIARTIARKTLEKFNDIKRAKEEKINDIKRERKTLKKFTIMKYLRGKKIDINLKCLKDEILDINKNIPLGSSTWENNRKEIRTAILRDNALDFLNWKMIAHTMFHNPIKDWYLEVMENNLLSTAIKETKIGNPKPYCFDSSTSGNLITQAHHISELFKKM